MLVVHNCQCLTKCKQHTLLGGRVYAKNPVESVNFNIVTLYFFIVVGKPL